MRAWKKVLCHTGQDKTKQGSIAQYITIQNKTLQALFCADWQIAHHTTRQHTIGQYGAEHNMTLQNITSISEGFVALKNKVNDNIGQHRTKQNKTTHNNTVHKSFRYACNEQ